MSINSKLPDEIIELILRKLPFFNLPTCRQVCKAWNNYLISSSNLFLTPPISNHFYLPRTFQNLLHCIHLDAKGMNIAASFSLLHPVFDILVVSPCNGLVCFRNTVERTVGILNPMTNEYIILPRGEKGVSYYYGFGFSSKTNKCKVIRLSYVRRNGTRYTSIENFTFDTCQWSHVANLPLVMARQFIHFNGAMYGFGFYPQQRDLRSVIWRWDVDDEKIVEIPLPPMVQHDNDNISYGRDLNVLNGSVYLSSVSVFPTSVEQHHVWKMETRHGKEEEEDSFSWSRAFETQNSSGTLYLKPIAARENGKILCVRGRQFLLYDPKIERIDDGALESSTTKRSDDQMILCDHFQIHSFNFHPLSKILAGEA